MANNNILHTIAADTKDLIEIVEEYANLLKDLGLQTNRNETLNSFISRTPLPNPDSLVDYINDIKRKYL